VGCIASLQGQPEVPDPCAGLAASLSRLRLIDEYRLYLHPVVLGGGKPFFEADTSLKLRPLGVESLARA
jgi:riboflavin biosynthesis pyrimidine reductase